MAFSSALIRRSHRLIEHAANGGFGNVNEAALVPIGI
jgi:hypothetical protein